LVDACDVFINIPGLRTHALPKFSNGMKNLMGLLPDQTPRLVHEFGLDGSICDLNAYRPSDLVITEAIYTLEGNFPSEGTPRRTDTITVADNVVAADLVAARLLGIDPGEVFYLQEAIERGLGPAGLEEVELVGDDLETWAARWQIEQAPRDPEAHRGPHRLAIEHACVSCRQALAGGLVAAGHRVDTADMEGVTILAGYQEMLPVADGGKVLLYGNCAYRYRHLGHYEPGCPPLAGQVVKGLAQLKDRRIKPSMCSIAWRNEPIEAVVPLVAEAGYLGLEAWGPHLDRYVAEHGDIDGLAAMLREHSLQVPMISGYYDLADDLEGSLETARRYLRFATVLGAPLIRVFTGGGDAYKASIATWRAVVEGLRALCALDPTRGFALETHAGHLHDSTESTLRLIRQANCPNLGVNLDIYNLFVRGEDPVRALKRLRPWVRILHLKNGVPEGRQEVERDRGSISDGSMDYGPFFKALSESRYDGFASVEWFGSHPEQAARQELQAMRRLLGRFLEVR
ncbi:MAG: TIM barrel protein, partial [Chloroflexi bacterium]|nr:TIM barrel protein [Chloroflexota bacterium]